MQSMKRFFLILTAVILFPLALSAKGEKVGVIAMSYNIRYGTASDGTNSWQYRYGASAMMLDDHKPTSSACRKLSTTRYST